MKLSAYSVQLDLIPPDCVLFSFTIQKGTGYVEGDPVNFYDPMGLYVCLPPNCGMGTGPSYWGPPAPGGGIGGGDAGWGFPSSDSLEQSPDGQVGQLAGGGGDGGDYARVHQEIPGAISLALSALNIPSCAHALGYGVTADGIVTASDVLRGMASGTAYGTISAAFIPPSPGSLPDYITNATTNPNPITLAGYSEPAFQITINDAFGTSFNPSSDPTFGISPIFGTTAITQAVTVLHELGHVMQLTFGAGLILPDNGVTRTGVSQSGDNTATIHSDCFPGVQNRGVR
jgi:hypothetical protein